MEAGIGGQSSYDVGCILFSNIKNQKKTCTLNLDTKNKVQIQIQLPKTKNKVSSKNKNNIQNTKYIIQYTTYIVYKL